MIENWDQYKDLKYYPDRVCKCGCGGRIKVKSYQKYQGIPRYIRGHNGRVFRVKREIRFCVCGCGETFECKINSKKRYISGHYSRGKHSNAGVKRSKEFCRKRSEIQKQLWRDPEYVAMQMIARNVCPNKAEEFLEEFFQNLFSNEYKFVGDGKDKDFIIAGKCPDFVNINGQKKIIELFGEHVHKPEEEQQRTDLFAQEGYQTLIIWYSELKDVRKLTEEVLNFNGV